MKVIEPVRRIKPVAHSREIIVNRGTPSTEIEMKKLFNPLEVRNPFNKTHFSRQKIKPGKRTGYFVGSPIIF